jgi:hypothetical protein
MGWAVVDPELCFAAGRASRSTGAASRNAPEVAGDRYKPIRDLAVAVEWVVTGAR